MRRPVRLNRAIWPTMMYKLRRGLPDPRRLLDQRLDAAALTETLKCLKIGTTFKTTHYDRFPETTRLLSKMSFAKPPVVLDVGASDGSAALAVMEQLAFARYYVTDRHIKAYVCPGGFGMYLCDADARPWLYANRCFVIHNDLDGAEWPFNTIAARVFKRFDSSRLHREQGVDMINPELAAKRGDKVRIEPYSIFDEWPHEKADLIIAANLLNRVYFPDSELRDGLVKLRNAMRDGALLAVIENRNRNEGSIEQSTVFRRAGKRFLIEARIGTGSDIQDLVTSMP
ncbi:MAG: hypothetical protein ACREPK_08880 [Rhodanobacteraceae bacterium]